MIHFLARVVGWTFMTLILSLLSLLLVGGIGLAWIWEHTIGRLWQRRK